jgi:hypothetical protein
LIAPKDELLLALSLNGLLPEGDRGHQEDPEDDESDGDAQEDVAGIATGLLASHSTPPRARS